MRRLKDAPSEAKCQKIAEMLDQDHDGALDLGDVGMVGDKCYHYIYLLQFVSCAILPRTGPRISNFIGICNTRVGSASLLYGDYGKRSVTENCSILLYPPIILSI